MEAIRAKLPKALWAFPVQPSLDEYWTTAVGPLAAPAKPAALPLVGGWGRGRGSALAFLAWFFVGGRGGDRGRFESRVHIYTHTPFTPQTNHLSLPPLSPPLIPSSINQCLRRLALSGWNPPPAPRRVANGDLCYVEAETLDGAVLHITAIPTGFYVNRYVVVVGGGGWRGGAIFFGF